MQSLFIRFDDSLVLVQNGEDEEKNEAVVVTSDVGATARQRGADKFVCARVIGQDLERTKSFARFRGRACGLLLRERWWLCALDRSRFID